MIHDTSSIRRKPDLITADVEEEAVVLNGATGIFYQLNTSAARLWLAIETPQTLAALCSTMVAAFDVTAEACRADLVEVIEAMHDRGLVEIG